VRKGRIGIERVPSFLEPFAWDFALDPAIDVLVRVSNQTDGWGTVRDAVPVTNRLRIGATRLGGVLEAILRPLTKLAWWLVMHGVPLTPGLKRSVDDFLSTNPNPADRVEQILAWLARNAGDLVLLTDLFVHAMTLANELAHADAETRKSYATVVVLTFIEEEVGLPERGTIRFRFVLFLVDAGIDLAARLLLKHGGGQARIGVVSGSDSAGVPVASTPAPSG
jgi:hypothetical protein